MDKIDLDELERLAAQATPGPWKHRTISKTATVILAADTPLCATKYSVNKDHDAAYIVAACNHAPELAARVRELERQRNNLAEYMETMCRYCDRDGHCPIFNYCPAPNLLKSCGDMKKADWIQAAEEAGE